MQGFHYYEISKNGTVIGHTWARTEEQAVTQICAQLNCKDLTAREVDVPNLDEPQGEVTGG